jgi:hypothetical protein
MVAAGLLLVSPAAVLAITTVTIGNGPFVPGPDTYLNAGALANSLASTSVQIAADTTITIADDIDLATAVIP